MSKKTHRPFGMDEGVHKMCEELFANRHFKSSIPENIDKMGFIETKNISIYGFTAKGLMQIMIENDISFDLTDEMQDDILHGKTAYLPVYKGAELIMGILISRHEIGLINETPLFKKFPKEMIRARSVHYIANRMRRGGYIDWKEYPNAETFTINKFGNSDIDAAHKHIHETRKKNEK